MYVYMIEETLTNSMLLQNTAECKEDSNLFIPHSQYLPFVNKRPARQLAIFETFSQIHFQLFFPDYHLPPGEFQTYM